MTCIECKKLRLRLAILAPEEEWRGLFLKERKENERLRAEVERLQHTADAHDCGMDCRACRAAT